MDSQITKKPTFHSSVFLDYTQNIKEDIICSSKCKLCQSKFRIEAEQKYEESNRNITAVLRFLKANGEEITHPAVRNHLVMHYQQQDTNIRVREYAKNLEPLLVQKRDKRSQLKERIAILEKESYDMLALTDGSDLDEKRKTADTLKKMFDTIIVCEKEIDIMDEALKPVDLMVKNLQVIVSEVIKEYKSEEVKRALMSVWDKVTASVADTFVESD